MRILFCITRELRDTQTGLRWNEAESNALGQVLNLNRIDRLC